ncbi:MAG: dihydroorotate dehydrogenase 2 [Chloroflexi bacterium]|nr:dihydroorotate dehydrogenase 2 [Chloroflexota bacterium]
MDLYKSLVRPLLFRIDPETAHHLAKPMLRSAALCRLLAGGPVRDPRLAVRVSGLVFPNPVGLAPGFDKHAELTTGMSRLGFGYLVPGTIMSEPRAGNPRPRIVRLPEREAMMNCMGLPSKGPAYCAAQLSRRRSLVPIIASFGAMDFEGYLRCFETVQPVANALELNLRCNNNLDDAGDFLRLDNFDRLMAALAKRKSRPLFVKINNYDTEAERQERLEVVERAMFYGADGFSTLSVWKDPQPRLSVGRGTVTGRPLFARTLQAIRDLREVTKGKAAIRARGGIFSGADAFQAIAAGATTVELLTALVYEGWGVARRINAELLALLDQEGIPSLEALRGSAAGAPTRA